MGKLKITGVVSDIVKKKIDDIIDNKKGTVKKLDEKDKEIAQKNIDANKPKTKSQQKNLRPVYLKPIGPKPKPSAKQVQVDKAKQNRKNKIETSTKYASKELQEKFKKQQENLKKLKEDKTKTIKPKTTVKGKKVYDKPIGVVPKGKKIFDKPIGPLPRGKKIFDKPIGPSPKPSAKQQQTNKAKLNRAKRQNKSRAVPKGIKVYNKSIGPRPKSFFQKYKKPIAGATVVGATIPAMINVDNSKVKSKTITNKKVKSLKKETAPKINKPKTSKVDVKKLEKKRTNITAGGNTGFGPKGNIFAKNEKDRKRLMDLYGGTGSAAYKAAVKGTQGNLKVAKKSTGGDLKSLPPKSENPGIHKLPAKAKMNMGFKPMFGAGLVSSFYDKPEKSEKHKGNMSVARQVKGYGKAKKKT